MRVLLLRAHKKRRFVRLYFTLVWSSTIRM
jgi:hypothetical protein